MFKRLREKKRGQSTAEYAILISLVVAAVIAMQTYAKRALQARIQGAATFMSNVANGTDLCSTLAQRTQYEPYYLESDFNVKRDQETQTNVGNQLVSSNTSTNIVRAKDGFQSYSNEFKPGD